MKISGKVVKHLFAPGSKSEHMAIALETALGERHRVTRQGGNPFQDDQLEKLVGKKIEAEGEALANNFVISQWKEIP